MSARKDARGRGAILLPQPRDARASATIVAGLLLAGAGQLATPAAVQARMLRAIPTAMTGAWGWSTQSCASPDDDGRLIVTAKSAAFAAAAYRFQSIDARPDGAFRITASTSEEGEAGVSTGVIELKLLAPDRLSVETAAAGTHVYRRCAPQAPR